MDWQDNEFEGFLKRFRLREARPLSVADAPGAPVRRIGQWKIAAAAVLVVAIGASAAIVRQLTVKGPTDVVVEKTPVSKIPAPSGPVATLSQIPSITPPVKPDPKPRDPLKQLTKVMPPPEQDAGPQSSPTPPPISPEPPVRVRFGEQDVFFVSETQTGLTGPQILNTACGSCHSIADAVKSNFGTFQEYVSLVNRMAGMGASVTPGQALVLSDYLFKTYGKKKEPEPGADDRGKTAFNAACGQCHSLELMDNRKDGDRASYETLVNSMNAYGAGLTPEQIDPLVDYLFRTYGRRPRA